MGGDPIRVSRDPMPVPARATSLLCTLSDADGRTIGALSIALDAAEIQASQERAALLRRGAAVLGRAMREGVAAAAPEDRVGLSIRVVLMRDGEALEEQLFPAPAARHEMAAVPSLPLGELVEEYERSLIEEALRTTRGNRSRAARLLQTTERILGYRIQRYGIDAKRFRPSGGQNPSG